MSVEQISDKLISWEGNQYRKINPRKKYVYKLDPEQKKARAAYMKRYRLSKKNPSIVIIEPQEKKDITE